MIHVTKTFLPPQEEYNAILKRAWDKKWLTNRGELVLELEQKLKHFLVSNKLILTNNGTIPLQIALKVFANSGEVITTPFSYVATVSSIIWENCTPVFVDIHPEYLTIDETKIEEVITSKTKAIVATHVFGNPCNVSVIQNIAKKYSLKVIYDAAHCFNVSYEGQSIFNYGDVSTCSFHATKLFQTGEGGAIFCNDSEFYNQLFYSHNFGHDGQVNFHGLGINGKMSELQAAMGLTMLPYISYIIYTRKQIIDYYIKSLQNLPLQFLKIREGTTWNYSYFPVIFNNEAVLLKVLKALNQSKIYPRRYFYPSLNKLPYIDYSKMLISESIASKILCLPLYVGLTDEDIDLIANVIKKELV